MSASCQLIRSPISFLEESYLTEAIITKDGEKRVCEAARIDEVVDEKTRIAFRKYADKCGGLGARISGGMSLFGIGALVVFLTGGPLNIIIALTIIGGVGTLWFLKYAGAYVGYLYMKSIIQQQLARKAVEDSQWFVRLPPLQPYRTLYGIVLPNVPDGRKGTHLDPVLECGCRSYRD